MSRSCYKDSVTYGGNPCTNPFFLKNIVIKFTRPDYTMNTKYIWLSMSDAV